MPGPAQLAAELRALSHAVGLLAAVLDSSVGLRLGGAEPRTAAATDESYMTVNDPPGLPGLSYSSSRAVICWNVIQPGRIGSQNVSSRNVSTVASAGPSGMP